MTPSALRRACAGAGAILIVGACRDSSGPTTSSPGPSTVLSQGGAGSTPADTNRGATPAVETVVATGSTNAAGDVVFAGLTPLPYRIDAIRAGGGATTTIRIAPPYASTVRVAVIIRPNS